MFRIKVADVCVEIDNRYGFVEDVCRDYIVKGDCIPAFRVQISSDEINRMLSGATWNLTAPMAESYLINRALCRKMAEFDAYLFHSAVITYGGKCIAFSGKRGTGKSTHVGLWKDKFGKDVTVVNGDKPLLALRNGQLIAYGTPWCGKEGWNINTSVPLTAICFLRRGEKNTIAPLKVDTALGDIMPQLLIPDDAPALMATLDLLDGILTDIPLYELHCTISEEAARIARAAMKP